MTLVVEPDAAVALVPVQRGVGKGMAPGVQLANGDRQSGTRLRSVTTGSGFK